MVESDKLLDFYSSLYDLEEQASEIRKDIKDQLEAQAKESQVSSKVLKAGYNLYKKYKNGKNTQVELDDYQEIESAIMSYFANEQEF